MRVLDGGAAHQLGNLQLKNRSHAASQWCLLRDRRDVSAFLSGIRYHRFPRATVKICSPISIASFAKRAYLSLRDSFDTRSVGSSGLEIVRLKFSTRFQLIDDCLFNARDLLRR